MSPSQPSAARPSAWTLQRPESRACAFAGDCTSDTWRSRADLLLIASELAGNAITHTASRGGLFAAEVTYYMRAVRVTVADQGAPDGPRLIRDPAAEHGRGLQVIQALSARAGVTGNHRGRQVWAEVSWPGAGDAGQEAAGGQAIRDSESWLASRLQGTPAWYGRATCQWWAMTSGALITAPTAQELARLLGVAPPPRRLAAAGAAGPGPAGSFPSRLAPSHCPGQPAPPLKPPQRAWL